MPLETTHLNHALTLAFDEFISTFASISENDINTIPFPGSWTPVQVAKHIVLATEGLPDMNTRPADRQIDSLLPSIRPWWEDPNQKFTSPQPLRPDAESANREEILTRLHHVRYKNLRIIAEKDLSLICLDFELPSIGYLTRYEWLWFIEMHLKRHTFQLKNIASVLKK